MPQQQAFMVRGRRCPCGCDGNGALVYLACPGCGRIVLVCDEIGNVFDNLESPLDSSPLVLWRSSAQRCPGCKAQLLADFKMTDEEQLLQAGIRPDAFEATLGVTAASLKSLSSM